MPDKVKASMVDAVTRYAADVRRRNFPGAEHVYRMEAGEEEKLTALLASL